MNPQPTPKHRAEQTTPTRPRPEPTARHRRDMGPTLSERLKAARSA